MELLYIRNEEVLAAFCEFIEISLSVFMSFLHIFFVTVSILIPTNGKHCFESEKIFLEFESYAERYAECERLFCPGRPGVAACRDVIVDCWLHIDAQTRSKLVLQP